MSQPKTVPIWELAVTVKQGEGLHTTKYLVAAEDKREIQRFVQANHGEQSQWSADPKTVYELRREHL
jgi:hypothetical protein